MKPTRLIPALVAACALAAVSSSCSAEDAGMPTSQQSQAQEVATETVGAWQLQSIQEATLISPDEPPTTGMQARFSGTLTLTEDGCFGLESPDDIVSAVVFPYGSELQQDRTIRLDGVAYALGDHIALEGGFVNEIPDISEQCGPAPRPFLANAISTE